MYVCIARRGTKVHTYSSEKDIEEKRRLFFVSATRARDELYVVAQRYAYGSKGNGKSIPDTRVQNIFLREAVWAVEQK